MAAYTKGGLQKGYTIWKSISNVELTPANLDEYSSEIIRIQELHDDGLKKQLAAYLEQLKQKYTQTLAEVTRLQHLAGLRTF